MDTRKHSTAGLPQSAELMVACSFPSSSALALVSPRMAKLCATIEHALSSIPVIRENPNLTTTLLSSPYRISYGMLNAMTNLTKRLIANPLQVVTDYYGSRESIVSRISELIGNLRFSLSTISRKRDEPCTLMHLNQLANQLQQLAENVANLQETNEESKAKSQQENLLAEVGDMKGYLELLYQQLKQEELKKIQIEEENCVLRQSIGKYSMIDSQTSWDISVKREADGISDKLSNFYSSLSHSAQLSTACLESKDKNPPAIVETSMDEFRLKISYLYQEGSIAWARPPKNGDTVVFTFHQPVLLKRFKIGTGHYEYPTNKLSDATVEILLMSSDIEIKNLVVTSDDYLVVGKFDESGLAEGNIDWHTLGTVQRLRVNIHSNHQNWVVMSELSLETVPLMGENIGSEEDFESW
ncbi:uncharacterized protein LOC124189973 [Daphnia pulex]|uniref:uncharacterized protein LOC124189973 n=1 Tax=Daphnia pulex TaxID=6669 RepID=UPI001EDFE3C9|nr:uncharacterized protein LOC124189973 [Daphnia pulex]